MKEIQGNIWDYHKQGHWIVITTNGTVRNDGTCVMGRGVAKQATQKYHGLAKQLGKKITEGGNKVYAFPEPSLFTLPVKHNWWEIASLKLIKQMLPQLIWYVTEVYNLEVVYMVRPGCGNGGLDWKDVKPILERYLSDKFIVVEVKDG